MIIRILAPRIMSYCRVMPLSLILARDSKLTISSWLTIHVILEHLAAFALVSVPLLTVYTVTVPPFVTFDFESLNKIRVWLCPVPVSVLYGCIIAKVLWVWPYTGTNLPCVGDIFVVSGSFLIL